MKTLLKAQCNVAVLLQLENSTAVAYMRECLQPSHPSHEITVALGSGERHNDHSSTCTRGIQHSSRQRVQTGERQVRLDAGLQGNQVLGSLEVDLFAYQLIHQLPLFFIWRPDPLAEVVDAFQQDWSKMRGYAHPL